MQASRFSWNSALFSIPANSTFSTSVLLPAFSFSLSHPSYMVNTFISCFFIFLWCSSCMESHTPSISSNSTGTLFFPSLCPDSICFTACSSSSLILSPKRCIMFQTPPALILWPQVLLMIPAVTR